MEWHSIDDGHYQLLYDRTWGSLTGHAVYADMYQVSNMHSAVLIDDRDFTFQPPNYKLSMKASQKEGHRPQVHTDTLHSCVSSSRAPAYGIYMHMSTMLCPWRA